MVKIMQTVTHDPLFVLDDKFSEQLQCFKRIQN